MWWVEFGIEASPLEAAEDLPVIGLTLVSITIPKEFPSEFVFRPSILGNTKPILSFVFCGAEPRKSVTDQIFGFPASMSTWACSPAM